MSGRRLSLLVRIAAAAAAGRTDALDAGCREAASAGIPPHDLQEALLQVFLFAGYPRAIVAFETLAHVIGTHPPLLELKPPEVEARGRALFGRIYAGDAERVLGRLQQLHPDFARFVIRDAYGLVLARPFLPLPERELMAVAMLGVLGLPNQLRAHVRGALRAGAAAAQVRVAIDAVEGLGDLAAAREAAARELPPPPREQSG
jgi:alkylhydroperoxidase/carboxymuconolactone decarboxylase family protein YurZ